MKKTILVVLALMSVSAFAIPPGFTSDYEAAKKASAESKKPMLVCFSGSDWCMWCINLDKEVFSDKSFAPAATGKYELVFIDQPKNKNLLKPGEEQRNRQLVGKFGVRGLPTVLVIDANEKVLAQSGYQAGGAKKWLASLDKEVKIAPVREEALGKQVADLKAVMDRLDSKLANVVPSSKAEMDKMVGDALKEELPALTELEKSFAAAKVPSELNAEKDNYLKQVRKMIQMAKKAK